jgi:hypothetical protein
MQTDRPFDAAQMRLSSPNTNHLTITIDFSDLFWLSNCLGADILGIWKKLNLPFDRESIDRSNDKFMS